MAITESDDSNPWSDGDVISDKNEDNPSGNDWWAEAIDAYSAWEYVDSHSDSLSDVIVGVLDSGFDVTHEDLHDITVLNYNSESDHGTHVAGIIAAENNTVGVRGIADRASLLCVDWSQVLYAVDGAVEEVSLLSTGEWVEMIKQLVENGAKVVNNSWGAYVEGDGLLDYLADVLLSDDDSISTDIFDSWSTSTTNQCLWLMVSLLNAVENGEIEDFLIVQGAGNGYDNGGQGYDASESGYFCGITEGYFPSYDVVLQKLDITFEDIKSHVLIVGAVENEKNNDGNYLMASFSNYGEVVDICAPGKNIYSTLTLLDDDSDNSNNGLIYGNLSGTSMAAPMVSGAAALVWSINPDLTAAEVKEILCTSTSTHAIGVTGEDAGNLYPMLNVGLAVDAVTALSDSIDYENLVTDAYSESFGTIRFKIPQINIDSEYVSSINQEIWNVLYEGVVEEIVTYWEENNYDGSEYIYYEWYVNGDILSLVIESHPADWAWWDYYVYNIEITSGAVLSDAELLSYYGMSEDEYYETVRQALYDYYSELYEEAYEVSGYDEQLARTISDENVNLAVPFLNNKSQLCIIGRVYSMAGAEYYDHIINLESDEMDFNSLLLTDASEDDTVTLPDENVIYTLSADYDEDGREETFIITGIADDYLTGYYTNVDIYFQSSDGEVTKLQTGTYGYLRGKNYLDTGTSKFLVWEISAGGSGSMSLIYGVKNGQIYEPELSGNIMNFDFSYESENTYSGLMSDWSNGYHDYIEHTYIYNSNTGEFEEVSETATASAIYYTIDDIIGTWELDADATTDANNESITTIFGSSYKYGNEMIFSDDGSFSYYISFSGGTGTWEIRENGIYYEITPYEEGGLEAGILTVDEDGYLIMDYLGYYKLYWTKCE
ncbi:MAG: S8 family serine peptidase [Oscillospiraceae bacterium]|nr:S8 family serine peptidase [Oscillospiraceae bacterium]